MFALYYTSLHFEQELGVERFEAQVQIIPG